MDIPRRYVRTYITLTFANEQRMHKEVEMTRRRRRQKRFFLPGKRGGENREREKFAEIAKLSSQSSHRRQ